MYRKLSFGRQWQDAGLARGAAGTCERGPCSLDTQAPHRNARRDQFVGGARCRRQRCGIEVLEQVLRLVKATYQEQTPDREMPRMRGVGAVAVPFEHRTR